LVSIISGSKKAMGHDVLGGIPNPASRVIHFNDLEALEQALAPGDIACVLTEPALTNGGIVFPQTGYMDSLRQLTYRYGTLLIIDETHTITAGTGGLTQKWNLKPDVFTMGKPIGGGIPSSVVGFSSEIAANLVFKTNFPIGIGGTLSGNPLQIAAIKANLESVLTESNFEYLIGVSNIIGDYFDDTIAKAELPWHLDRIGGRLELGYSLKPFRNFAEYQAMYDPEIDVLRRLYMANRGIWVTPVHSTMHICPQVTLNDAEMVNKTFAEFVSELTR
jgi:glutamate-1-semialdehyde 2,1-aminomutase